MSEAAKCTAHTLAPAEQAAQAHRCIAGQLGARPGTSSSSSKIKSSAIPASRTGKQIRLSASARAHQGGGRGAHRSSGEQEITPLHGRSAPTRRSHARAEEARAGSCHRPDRGRCTQRQNPSKGGGRPALSRFCCQPLTVKYIHVVCTLALAG